MRIEPAPYVFRNEDRRQRFNDRRGLHTGHGTQAGGTQPRAVHPAPRWFAPAFGAHILGQVQPHRITTDEARRAYEQPESRTPLRPSIIRRA